MMFSVVDVIDQFCDCVISRACTRREKQKKKDIHIIQIKEGNKSALSLSYYRVCDMHRNRVSCTSNSSFIESIIFLIFRGQDI